MKEADLYPMVKQKFKERGYTVFAEVACYYRGVDMVAVKNEEQIAIELKLSFNDKVCQQAIGNRHHFDKSYVAYPVKKVVMFHNNDIYWSLRENARQRYGWLESAGVGILQILPSGVIYEALEPTQQSPYRKLDLTNYIEADDDVGGLPFQKRCFRRLPRT